MISIGPSGNVELLSGASIQLSVPIDAVDCGFEPLHAAKTIGIKITAKKIDKRLIIMVIPRLRSRQWRQRVLGAEGAESGFLALHGCLAGAC